MADTIDWNAPLEAYHPDGRVVGVTYFSPFDDGLEKHFITEYLDERYDLFLASGESAEETDWRIRNRKPTASEHPGYSPELVERAFKLVGNMARDYYDLPFADAAEAKAILSELDKAKEVDPLVAEDDPISIEDQIKACIRAELNKLGYVITRKDEAA